MAMEEKLLELGKNGGLTISGISGAVLFQLVTSGNFGIPFWVFSGLFIGAIAWTSITAFFKKKRKPENRLDLKGDEDLKDTKDLLDVLKDYKIDKKSLRLYLENVQRRPNLLNHSIFTTTYYTHKDEIRKLKEMKQPKTDLEVGKNYLIRFYLTLRIEVARYRFMQFIKENVTLIKDNYNTLDGSIIKNVIYNLMVSEVKHKEGYNYLAEKKYNYPTSFLSQFNALTRPFYDDMTKKLELILSSPYYETDYSKYGAILDIYEDYQNKIFSFNYLDKYFNINSDFDEYAEEVGNNLKLGIVKDFSGIDDLGILRKELEGEE